MKNINSLLTLQRMFHASRKIWRWKRTLKGEGQELYWSKRKQEEETGGEERGGWATGVLDSDNNGWVRWQPSLIGRMR